MRQSDSTTYDFIPLDDTREVHYHKDGFLIIRPKGHQKPVVPFDCPICTQYMREVGDARAWKIFGCCTRCKTRWVDRDRQVWEDGWRPNRDEIEAELRRRNG